MKDFFKTMDLYKGIVLLSLILLPVGGWYISEIDKDIVACKKAIVQATRQKGGFLMEIGKQKQEIENITRSQRSGGGQQISSASTWFEGQIIDASPGLKADAFRLSAPKEEPARGVNATDHVIEVTWKDKRPAHMDFVYAVLFNCESGATNSSSARGHQSVWRLRELHLQNTTKAREIRAKRVPPPELQDSWEIKKMKFARRAPRAEKRRRG